MIVIDVAASRPLTPAPSGVSDIRLEISQITAATPSGTSTLNGQVANIVTGASSTYSHEVAYDFGKSSPTIENLTPSICEVNGLVVTRLTNGVGVITAARSPSTRRKRFQLDCTTKTGASIQWFKEYEAGSVPLAFSDELLALLDAAPDDPGTDAAVMPYITANHAAGTYSRNATCWLADADLSGLPVATDIFGSWTSANRGAAITARHVVAARHWNGNVGFSVGNRFRFLTNTGEVLTRTIIGRAAEFDIVVGTLDAALPASVSVVSIAGEWADQGSAPSGGEKVCFEAGLAFHIDQNLAAKAALRGRYADSTPGDFQASWTLPTYSGVVAGTSVSDYVGPCSFLRKSRAEHPHTSILSGKWDYLKEPVIGDSGSAVALLLPSGPALLTSWSNTSSGQRYYGNGGQAVLNALIAGADADAVSRGHIGSPTGLTVTVAPDPTD